MAGESTAPDVVCVGSGIEGTTVERLRAGLASASVAAVEDPSALGSRFDSTVECIVLRADVPDGTGLDAHELVGIADPAAPVVLLAEPTGEVAATAVQRDIDGFVPLVDGRPSERLVETVDRVRSQSRGDAGTDERTIDGAQWKADILDQLFARLPVHLYVKDEAARHVLVSQAHVEDQSSVLGWSDLESELVPTAEARDSYEDDLQVLETGDPLIDHEEYYPSNDEWYLTSKVPRYDEDGHIVGLIGVSREITERRKAQERLETVNDRLEQFVSVVSHDLRNPLTVAHGRVEYERTRRDSEHLAATERALTRMESLIDDLLTLAQGDDSVSQTDRLRLSTVARASWEGVPTEGATLTVDSDRAFEGARGRVRQLFENLFRNAAEHGSTNTPTSDDDAVAHDPTGSEPEPDDSVGHGAPTRRPGSADGSVAVRVGTLEAADGFFVEDDGPGIPADQRDAVFESGYTTRASGTGFGLSIVADVAEAHGWSVTVGAAESGGARFEVTGVDPIE